MAYVGCQVMYLVGAEGVTSTLNRFIMNCVCGCPRPITDSGSTSLAYQPFFIRLLE